jgi:hypothetical protein
MPHGITNVPADLRVAELKWHSRRFMTFLFIGKTPE